VKIALRTTEFTVVDAAILYFRSIALWFAASWAGGAGLTT